MMGKNLIEDLENKKKYLFLSIDSNCLKLLDSTLFSIPSDGSEFESHFKNAVSYKKIMGKNALKFSSFERSGFFDDRFDLSFSFGMHYLVQKDYFVYDGDGLKKDEMSPMENLMKKVIRRKGKFEYGDEMLLYGIELNDAAGIIFYTKDAKKNVKKAGINKKIITFDLTKERSESFELYMEFDKKVQEGKVREFEWG